MELPLLDFSRWGSATRLLCLLYSVPFQCMVTALFSVHLLPLLLFVNNLSTNIGALFSFFTSFHRLPYCALNLCYCLLVLPPTSGLFDYLLSFCNVITPLPLPLLLFIPLHN
jgi:hypothetical protein